MTIKGLHEYIKKNVPSAIVENFDMNIMKGKIMAIDAFYLIYLYVYIAKKQVIDKTNLLMEEPYIEEINKILMALCMNGINKLTNFGIILYFVFDGKPPPEKEALKLERRRKGKESREEIDRIKQTIQTEFMVNNQEMLETLKKLYEEITYINSEFIEDFKIMLKESCIPYMEAPCEAEKMCSYLCKNGIVSAVLSSDGDNLCYGCPYLIKEFRGKYTLYIYENLLNSLEINETQFRDVCIMAECDYNKNIPNVGIGRAYNLIKKHGSIDNIPANYDKTCLNYKRCREIFTYDDIGQIEYDTTINFQDISNFNIIEKYSMMTKVNNIRSCLQRIIYGL